MRRCWSGGIPVFWQFVSQGAIVDWPHETNHFTFAHPAGQLLVLYYAHPEELSKFRVLVVNLLSLLGRQYYCHLQHYCERMVSGTNSFSSKWFIQNSISQTLRSDRQARYCTFLVLDLGLDILNGVTGFHLKGDRFTRQGFHEDLHLGSQRSVHWNRYIMPFSLFIFASFLPKEKRE